MYFSAEVTEGIFWVGANDRQRYLFEQIWPLPHGIVYNSFLLLDERTALVDTIGEGVSGFEYVERIESLLAGRTLDYLVVNHMEPDHSGTMPLIAARYPEVKIVGNRKTREILDVYYPNLAQFHEVEDGETISLGKKSLQFHMTPWVHWPETMMTYEPVSQTLFSGDAFGSFGAFDGAVFDDEMDAPRYEQEMLRYYSNIVGKYSKMVQRALAKLSALEVSIVAPTHGLIWREDPTWVIGRYDRWSRQEGEPGVVIVVASMYGSTMSMADYIARELTVNGVRRIIFHDVSRSHVSDIIRDVWRYKGLVMGSVAYNGGMFPLMNDLCHELLHLGVANKYLAIFGGSSWNGGGVRSLQKFSDEIGLPLVTEPVEMRGRVSESLLLQCDVLAKDMARLILE